MGINNFIKLGEVAISGKGKKPEKLSNENKNGYIPYIDIKAFEKNIFEKYTDGENCRLCEKGDILIVWDGSRSGLVGKAHKGAIGSTLAKINVPLIKKNFLYYFLLGKYQILNTRPKGTGTPHIDPDILWNFNFPIVSKETQKRIVQKIEELFSSLDKATDDLKKTQSQLKIYRQSVLKSAFEGKLTNKKVTKSELPDGWKWKTIKDISSVLGDGLHGTPKYCEIGDYYFINGNNLSDGKIEIKENTKRVSNSEFEKYKKLLNDKTIFVSINGTLGKTAYYNNEKVILGKSACYFNVLENIDKRYVRYCITSHRFINYANKNATGSTIKNVSLKAMREFEVPIPLTLYEQQLIVSKIESRFSVCDKLEENITESLKKIGYLRQSILKQAFEGKLVPQDHSDEPAEKLLEKIKKEKQRNKK